MSLFEGLGIKVLKVGEYKGFFMVSLGLLK